MLTRRTRRSTLVGLAGLLAAAAVAPRAARADATDDALAAVTKARADLKTLVATFQQTRRVGLLEEEVKSKGELTVVVPDQLRWELFPPDDVVYWVTRSGVYYRSKGKTAKAPPGPMTAMSADLLLFVGGDVTKLKARYDLKAKQDADGSVTIVASPKDADLKRALSRLQLRTNKERWGVDLIVIEEPSGDESTITFDANKKNEKVDPAKMKPPAS